MRYLPRFPRVYFKKLITRLGGLFFIVLLCLVFYGLELDELADLKILDQQFQFLKWLDSHDTDFNPVIVGIDRHSVKKFPEPPALWHQHLGVFFKIMAKSQVKMLATDIPLPNRSYDAILSGYDQALLRGLSELKQQKIPLFLGYPQYHRGHERPVIYSKFLPFLEQSNIGYITLLPDSDRILRRYQPRDDDWIVKILQMFGKSPQSGFINYTLGKSLHYIPLHEVLEWHQRGNQALLETYFKNKVVLLSYFLENTEQFYTPLPVMLNQHDSAPAVMVYAQILRTALDQGLIQPLSSLWSWGLVAVGFLLFWVIRKNIVLGLLSIVVWDISLVLISGIFLEQGYVLAIAGPIFVATLAFIVYSFIELQTARQAEAFARLNAELANKAKSATIASTSHELRTPVIAIIGYTEMILEDLSTQDDDLRQDLEKIYQASQHLLELINDILDISKIESGKLELNIEAIEIEKFVHEVASMLPPLLKQGDNTFQIDCDSDVGIFYADITRVRQSLFNLLSNACKFTEKGLITLSVRHQHSEEGCEWIHFIVTDTGIGISEQQLDKLFDAYTQADKSISKYYGGTGLGLAISQKLCHMMGGRIEVKSEEGKGSEFTMILPVVCKA